MPRRYGQLDKQFRSAHHREIPLGDAKTAAIEYHAAVTTPRRKPLPQLLGPLPLPIGLWGFVAATRRVADITALHGLHMPCVTQSLFDGTIGAVGRAVGVQPQHAALRRNPSRCVPA
jgi:hypothetical protein